MPRNRKENKRPQSTKNKRKFQAKNTEQPPNTALGLKQNIIKKCCVRVRRNHGIPNDQLATTTSLYDQNLAADEASTSKNSLETQNNGLRYVTAYDAQNTITIGDSSDEEQLNQNSSMECYQINPTTALKLKGMADSSAEVNKSRIHGFIGVEYIIKICDAIGEAMRYECALCELKFGFDNKQEHLISYGHRLKFCEQHFPSALQQFRQYIVNVPRDEQFKLMIPMLQKLAEAIENHHGRSQPFECHKSRFQKDRDWVFSKVLARFHASERNGPTFILLVDSKEVSKLIAEHNSVMPQAENVHVPICESSAVSPGQIVKISHEMRTHFHMSEPYHLDGPIVAHPSIGPRQHFDAFERSNKSHQHSLANAFGHPTLPRQQIQLQQDTYNRVFDHKLKMLNERFQHYKVNPATYPSYNEEWLKFLQSRKAMSITMDKDYCCHNYDIDWQSYFNERLKEHYAEAVELLKIQIQKELSLPLSNNFVVETNVFKFEPTVENRSIRAATSNNQVTLYFESNEMPNFVSVLGLLVALEQYLGSLAPKIVDLLTKALRAEKLGPACSLNLFNLETYTLLETALEKFKGMVMAGIVDGVEEQALEKAIEKVTAFLEKAQNII